LYTSPQINKTEIVATAKRAFFRRIKLKKNLAINQKNFGHDSKNWPVNRDNLDNNRNFSETTLVPNREFWRFRETPNILELLSVVVTSSLQNTAPSLLIWWLPLVRHILKLPACSNYKL